MQKASTRNQVLVFKVRPPQPSRQTKRKKDEPPIPPKAVHPILYFSVYQAALEGAALSRTDGLCLLRLSHSSL